MRVTQSSLTRNYMKNLNRNLSNLSKSSDRLTSGRKFSKVSENTGDAAKAFKVREQLYKNEQFIKNISDVQGELASAESNLMNVNSMLQQAMERVVQGKTDTTPEDARKAIGTEIKNLKEQILQTMNTKFGDKFLFGGSNNSTPPFATSATGELTFNGVVVSSIVKDPVTGIPSTSDGNVPPVFTPVPQNSPVYVDMGLGLTMTGNNLDTKSAMKVSTSGLDVLGFGTSDIDGVALPNNVFDFLTKVETEFMNNDMTEMDANLKQLQELNGSFMNSVTDVGTRSTFLEQTVGRVEVDIFNLKSTQQQLEAVSLEEESINNKSYEMAWMITLQLGGKILPPSIFDFMR